MTRRVVQHVAVSVDRERLTVITIYESGISKEQAKQINEFSKKHEVLIPTQCGYEWKG